MPYATKEHILEKLHQLVTLYVREKEIKKKFIPGTSVIRYAEAQFDARELNAILDTLLSGWFGLGKEGELFEKELASYVGCKHAYLVNSGSSADLIAFASLMSYQFPDRIKPGDEVITPACTFPTAVAALIHHKLKPVFVDVDLETLNPSAQTIEQAVSKKTRALFLIHNLGNPNDMHACMAIAKKHNLLVIEDNCDALGSTYDGKKTGTFGILATESFYPAHHITTAGEGGAVLINDMRLLRIVSSLREWGRACWCGASGGPTDGVCGVRFKYALDGIPYDHKYIFSHIGYNVKPIEMQAAMGRIQLNRVGSFIGKRRANFNSLYSFFSAYQDFFILPKAMPRSNPSWFAFPLTLKKKAPFSRFDLINYLEKHHIQTRPLFAGNILRQPGFKNIEHRISSSLDNSNHIFSSTFFIGVHPGLSTEHLMYIQSVFDRFIKKNA